LPSWLPQWFLRRNPDILMPSCFTNARFFLIRCDAA
jgi:hypothetical protein